METKSDPLGLVHCVSPNILKLSGKVAVVTAATDGIGFAIAKSLSENGAKVVISSRKEENVSFAIQQMEKLGLKNVIGTVCHVSNAEQRKNLFDLAVKKFGGIDILVSNAAVSPTMGLTLDCDEKVWDKTFEVNLKASYLLAKEAVFWMQKRGGGSIVFVSSVAAYKPAKMLGVYSITKTALVALTKILAEDLAVHNIRVNCLAPGVIKTKFSLPMTDGSVKDQILEMIPMNRFGHPDEMGGIVSFLCSKDASYITGETLVAAGGLHSRL